MASDYTPYNERSPVSIIFAMLLIKLFFFTFITAIFITPNLNPQSQLVGDCNVFFTQNANVNTDIDLEKSSFGLITPSAISQMNGGLSTIMKLTGCALSSNDIDTYMEKQSGQDGIPDLIWFILFDIWGYIIIILLLRIWLKF